MGFLKLIVQGFFACVELSWVVPDQVWGVEGGLSRGVELEWTRVVSVLCISYLLARCVIAPMACQSCNVFHRRRGEVALRKLFLHDASKSPNRDQGPVTLAIRSSQSCKYRES